MKDKLVVCFRSVELRAMGGGYLERATDISEKAAARGATVLAWGATSIAFEMDAESLEDAVGLAVSVVTSAAAGLEEGVGISEGPLARAEEATTRVTLGWGPSLVHATALARVARPGEILVDPNVSGVKKDELSTSGSRVATFGAEHVRGLLLDVARPFRRAPGADTASAGPIELVGRAEVSTMEVPPGALGVVRAARGHGGTRFLRELEQRLEPARALAISPHPFGEPLGALRRALLRAVTLGQAPLNLTGHTGEGLDALLAGEGLDPDSSAELLAVWLTPDSVRDLPGVVLLDDAAEIDADTLEVVARAAAGSGAPFRVVARIGDVAPLPPALAALPRAPEIRLGPLAVADALTLARAALRGSADPAAAAQLADRGGRLPLGIIEAVKGAVEGGEIVWEEGRAIARLRTPAEGARTPKHWVKRRLAEQAEQEKTVLVALAILGGQAELRDLTDLLAQKGGAATEPSAALAVLQASGWVARKKPDVIALPGATHRDAILTTLADAEFQTWHRAASECFARRDRPLAAAAATVHAVLAGDNLLSLELGRRAAAAIRAVGLEATATAFDAFSERGETAPLVARHLFMSQLEMARAAPSVWPAARSSVTPPAPQRSLPPPLPKRIRPAVTVAPPAEPAFSEARAVAPVTVADPAPERSMPPPKPAWAKRPKVAETPTPAPASVVAPVQGTERASMRPPGEAQPSAAVDAFRRGDLEAVERLASQIRVDENRSGLAERLQAMAKLARGETGDAIRRLRLGAEEARRTGSRDRCRAALALAVALGSANRHEEALIEALDALARARELADERGERACLRYLAQLSQLAGHHDVAEAWASVVRA